MPKRNHDVDFPGPMFSCVRAFAGVVSRQTRTHVGGHTRIVPVRVPAASEV